MTKDFDLVDMNDERTDKFAEVMSNPTSKKIYNYIKSKKSSKIDISKALKLPLSTVHYNLEKLHSAGLVEVDDYQWSEKGNKINIYKISKKVLVFTPEKSPKLEIYLKATLMLAVISIAVVAIFLIPGINNNQEQSNFNIEKFDSEKSFIDALKESSQYSNNNAYSRGGGVAVMELSASASDSQKSSSSGGEFSNTNIQVEGVDEADVIKTDGEYIYTFSNGYISITKAYPSSEAKILSEIKLTDFNSAEIYISENNLMVFGYIYPQYELYNEAPAPREVGDIVTDEPVEGSSQSGIISPSGKIASMPFRGGEPMSSIRIYDISNKENPKLIRTVNFEGNILTSRMIDSNVYFVINSYPNYYAESEEFSEIMPRFADVKEREATPQDLMPIARADEVSFIRPIQNGNLITLVSISIDDENKEIKKETILGAGENVYSSKDNIYIAQSVYPYYDSIGESANENQEKTVITKFSLNDGDIKFESKGQVPGTILNQFSMDEYDEHFRIATTKSPSYQGGGIFREATPEEVSSNEVAEVEKVKSDDLSEVNTNNIYVLDKDMNVVGKIENIAPGESIYSVRYMEKRAYVVTFRQVDPLFVIDLSDHENPKILGKLKIPGFSNYLHPYDEDHVIGIGKEVDASIDADKVHDANAIYYTAIQGVKISIFDVSDVENPIELQKLVIGDRGTESIALNDHKAFLFDKEKNLMVIPITLAELKPNQLKSDQGEFVFQGAFVLDINLDEIKVRGKITHYEDDSAFQNSGYYFYGDSDILRSLYIKDVLYTLSNKKLQLNDLDNLEKLKSIKLPGESQNYPPIYY